MDTLKALAVPGYLAAWFQNINDRSVRSTAPCSLASHVSHKRVWWEKPGSLCCYKLRGRIWVAFKEI